MIDPIIDTAWLLDHREQVALADVRWYLRGPPGEAAYKRGHIPGAVFVDLDQVLAGPPGPTEGRHPLPEPERFAAAMGELGIGDGDNVIAYDDDGGVIAARLLWMLRTLGSQAALLDGGLAGWTGPLESGRVARSRASFSARPWPADRIASIEDVAALVPRLAGAGAGGVPGGLDSGTEAILIDARDRARFEGGPDPVDPRSGHIPGARNLPARELAIETGRIARETDLRSRLERVGIRPSTEVVAYCGSGVTACYDLLMLERAGLGPGRLYAGSWSQWSRDPRRALETGAAR
jgi:thiosulfate/3-mercaptopyruvate sulfurtransferase